MKKKLFAAALLSLPLGGCAAEDPETSENDAGATIDGSPCAEGEPEYTEDVSGCEPADTDYMPRDNGSADDSWPECISDDDTYHTIEDSVSSIARVEAYEEIADLLWRNPALDPESFVDARVVYEQEEGLGSRVARRYDPHYDPPASGSCEEADVAEANPDYCVGPAKLQPILVEAFADGAQGLAIVENAWRIHAALQWFLYVSVIKEATTCADAPKDCDSAWAYYCGGAPRSEPVGLAGEIDGWAPATHDRAYDGVLAVRCWRDLDPDVPPSDPDMQERAIEQLDIALLRGMAILAREAFESIGCSTGDYREAAVEWLRILVPLLDRETRERDPAVADLLLETIDEEAASMDVEAAVAALDETYPCP